jgi:hypothetical protein
MTALVPNARSRKKPLALQGPSTHAPTPRRSPSNGSGRPTTSSPPSSASASITLHRHDMTKFWFRTLGPLRLHPGSVHHALSRPHCWGQAEPRTPRLFVRTHVESLATRMLPLLSMNCPFSTNCPAAEVVLMKGDITKCDEDLRLCAFRYPGRLTRPGARFLNPR